MRHPLSHAFAQVRAALPPTRRLVPALLTATLLAAALLATPRLVAPARAEEIGPAQREAVVKILRDALVQDPSILRDAIAALQADDARRQDKLSSDLIAMMGSRLVSPLDPVAGNPFGNVTVVEFYDTHCPYCRRMEPVLAELLQSDPNVRLVVKDLPILGPGSQLESQALLALQAQGGYFPMQAALFQSHASPTRDSLRAMADKLGLDGGRMVRDMDAVAIKDRLRGNIDMARQLGIDGTPAFIVGTKLLPGATELAELQKAIAAARAAP